MEQNKYLYIIIEKMRYFLSLNEKYPTSDITPFLIYILYGIHKQYGILEKKDDPLFFYSNNDQLLEDLYKCCKKHKAPLHLDNLYESLCEIDYLHFNKVYIDLIKFIYELKATDINNKEESFTPSSINKLLAYLIEKNNCNSVYDPFCGTASIVRFLKNSSIVFVGQDINYESSLIARIFMDYRFGKDNGISCSNSMDFWSYNHFDAVVSCPPFNLTQNFYGSKIKLEEIFYERAFNRNKSRFAIVLEPHSFSYSPKFKSVRKYLIDNNFLDSIICLPESLLFGTSIAVDLIICKKDRKLDSEIKFFDAEPFVKGDNNIARKFDVNKFITSLESSQDEFLACATKEQIMDYDYNFNYSLYNSEMIELHEGQELKLLGSLMSEAKADKLSSENPESSVIYPAGNLQKDLISIWQTKGKELEKSDSSCVGKKSYIPGKNSTFLLYSNYGASNLSLGLYSGKKDFICSPGVRVMRIHEEIVIPEYLVYLIINHPAIKKGDMPFKEYFRLPVAVDSLENQKIIVGRITQEYAQRVQAEQIADLKRLGVKQNISDLEHMLGSTKIKIDNVISRLSRMASSSVNYNETVKQLKDNVDYMFRVIHFNNASMENESINIGTYNIADYLEDYAKAWTNYGGSYFTLSVSSSLDRDVTLNFDKTMFTVMLDSILSNAVRHGFHKNKNHTSSNRVEISADAEIYMGNPYLVLRIANNGDPINTNFTIGDYITRGRYSATSGRSGLGGYHVYQIIKAHKGFLYLDSNKQWNMIVEILIPATYINKENLNEYEHDCI